MACLTRNLQKTLCKYIRSHLRHSTRVSPEQLRDELVGKGVCPSYVTPDQLAAIVKIAQH
ncbi:hypothetical protein [Alteromonas sp. a30]|uniref:hypothetical protein n=1 Tax=Alteromonas sp. a30 TaxID=2730917 RepID=UPI00227E4B97|nr:hypothetical protein [Alteromonas sp. a30]MCY7297167.1 hypothetical protein [Alteromonas sp. a30]